MARIARNRARGRALGGLVSLAIVCSASAGDLPVCSKATPRPQVEVLFPDLEVVDQFQIPRRVGNSTRALVLTGGQVEWTPFGFRWTSFDLWDVQYETINAPELIHLAAFDDSSDEELPRIAGGDMDGDGWIDLMVLRSRLRSAEPGVVEFLRARGDGSFERGPGLTDVSWNARFETADIDGDQQSELILVDCESVSAYQLENGSWVAQQSVAIFNTNRLFAADLDGDHDSELILIPSPGSTAVRILFGDPQAPWQGDRFFLVPFELHPRGVASQLDDDPANELVLASEHPELHEVTLHALELRPDGVQLEPLWNQPLPTGAVNWRPFDLDRDRVDELIVQFDRVVLGSYGFGFRGCESLVGAGRGVQVLDPAADHGVSLSPRSAGEAFLLDGQPPALDGSIPVLMVPSSRRGLFRSSASREFVFDDPLIYDAAPGAQPSSRGIQAVDLDGNGFDDLITPNALGSPENPAFIASLNNGLNGFQQKPGPSGRFAHETSEFHDLDGDGTLDALAGINQDRTFNRIVELAYGRGGGSFEPYRAQPASDAFTHFSFGDLDADGDDDILANNQSGRQLRFSYSPVIVTGRNWRSLPPAIPPSTSGLWLFDLDGDRFDDALSTERLDPTKPEVSLLWRRTRPGVRFDPPRKIASWSDSLGQLVALHFADLDHRAGEELLLVLDQGRQRTLWAIERVQNRFRTVARETFLTAAGSGSDRSDLDLIDIDRDGTLDLVNHAVDLRYWRGDGTGRFLVPAAAWHAGRNPAFLDVNGDGWQDGVGLSDIGLDRRYAISLTSVERAVEDLRAPELWLRVDPTLWDLDTTSPTFEDRWLLSARADDDCDANPAISAAFVFSIDVNSPEVSYRSGESVEIRIYATPDSILGTAWSVVLQGPDEAQVRSLWQTLLATREIAISLPDSLDLTSTQEVGPTSAAFGDAAVVTAGFRLHQRLWFAGHRLVGASSSYPGGDLVFVGRATDDAGNPAAEVYRSLNEEVAKLCAQGITLSCR